MERQLLDLVANSEITAVGMRCDLPALSSHFGLSYDNTFELRTVREHLYEEIRREIRPPSAVDVINVRDLGRHLILRRMADGAPFDDALGLLAIIRDATRPHEWVCRGLGAKACWRRALTAARNHLYLDGRSPASAWSQEPRINALADAAEALRGKGFAIKVSWCALDVEAHEVAICEQVERHVCAAGGQSVIDAIFDRLRARYDPEQERYHQVQGFGVMGGGGQKPKTPYGYLLNLAAKRLDGGPSAASTTLQEIDKAIALSTALAAAYDVQPYSQFEIMFQRHEGLVRFLQETVALDSLHAVPQDRPSDVGKTLNGLFSWIDPSVFAAATGVGLNVLVVAVDAILQDVAGTHGIVLITEREVAKSARIALKDAITVLSVLSHAQPVNCGYLRPLDVAETTCWMRPFHITEGGYLLLDARWGAPSFYEAVVSRLREARVPGLEEGIGIAAESFLREQMLACGMRVTGGEYVSSVGAGECDLVVETDDVVIFLELKKKPLTRRARSAEPVPLLRDLAKALIEPQLQAGRHELALLTDGFIELDDNGTTHRVAHAGRRVERVAVTLLDFGALHSREVAGQLLELMTGAKVTSKHAEVSDDCLKDARCASEGLQRQFDRFVQAYGEEPPMPYFHCWFLGLSQVLLLLDNVESNESFQAELFRTRHVTTGCMSWNYEYRLARRRAEQTLAPLIEDGGPRIILG